MEMENEDKVTNGTFGAHLLALRMAAGLSQKQVAAAADISAGYYGGIEGGKSLPPPDATLSRVLDALHCYDEEADAIRQQATSERGFPPQDASLPAELQRLMRDLRLLGPTLPERFIRALRTSVREAAD